MGLTERTGWHDTAKSGLQFRRECEKVSVIVLSQLRATPDPRQPQQPFAHHRRLPARGATVSGCVQPMTGPAPLLPGINTSNPARSSLSQTDNFGISAFIGLVHVLPKFILMQPDRI